MVADQARCENCGTPLSLEDVKCPACGAPVNTESEFPPSEVFVDASYQNIEDDSGVVEETIISTGEPVTKSPEVIDLPTEDVAPDYSSSAEISAEQIDAAYTAPKSTGSNTAMRTCLITCGVIFIVGFCCFLIFMVILYFTGDIILSIFNEIFGSMGINF